MFEPSVDVLMMFDEDLVIGEQLVVLKKGVNKRIKVSVVNTTDRDIEIPGRLVLGDINLVSAITPMPVMMKMKDSETCETPVPDEVAQCNPVGVGAALVGNNDEEQYSKLKKHIESMKLDHLSEDVRKKVREMLWRKRQAFVADNGEIGEANELQMKIQTTDDIPVQKNYYKIPKPLIEEVKEHVCDLLDRGWIKESTSANSSPVVLVRKKGGGLRVCCDFRELNRKTIPDKHPLPRITDTLENLGGSSWFTVIDQTRAYYQGFIDPDSRWKTAFVTPWGLYEWVRIPFGLMNAPSAFQRHMEHTLREFRDLFAAPYLDDVIVYSKSISEHIGHVEKVLEKFIQKGLKVGFEKCNFFQQEVKFLGRIVNSKGYRMDEESVEAVKALKDHKPTTLGEVRQLLGLVGYHRRQIQDFAAISHPLTELLKTGAKDVGEKSTSKRPVNWLDEHQEALDRLIDAISSQPIMAYPDYNEKFFVHTDASGRGLGCILYQIQEGEKRVISYGSRSLLPAEKNYHSTKLEFLALKWAICDKFRDYLGYGNAHFTVYTDNNPLLYVLQSTKLNANGQRWVSELSEFNFTVKYRPGTINKDADCLSRIPLEIDKYEKLCKEEFDPDCFHALVAGVQVRSGEETWLVNACQVRVPEFGGKLTLKELKQAQEEDDVIRQVKELIEVAPKEWKNLDEKVKELFHHRKSLYVDRRGLLCRRRHVAEKGQGDKDQVVWPESLRHLAYQWFHEDMGHVGPARVMQLCRSRLFWPKMNRDVEEFINQNCQCLSQKKPARHKEAELQSIETSAPLELITIDYLKLEKGVGGYQYILLVVDHFTRYVQGYATKNKSSTTAAKKIYGDFILKFGLPSQILHDQGREFENNLFAELETLCGVKKLRTTPYHPQCNGMVERMNKTVLGMLRTLPERSKSRWPESLDKLIYAYNCTTHDTTGYEPYFLMFGRRPKLPIDLILGDEEDEVNQEEYAQKWERQMREAYRIVQEKSATRKQKDIDRRKRDGKKILGDLVVGDRVLVKNVRKKKERGPGKLRSHWEQKVYVVTEKKSEVVYAVMIEGDKSGKVRVLHRNLLLPVGQWFHFVKPDLQQKKKAPVRKQVPAQKEGHVPINPPEDDVDEEEGGDWFSIYPAFQQNPYFQPYLNDEELNDAVADMEEEDDGEDDDTVAYSLDENAEQEVDHDVAIENDADEDATIGYDQEEGRQLLEEIEEDGNVTLDDENQGEENEAANVEQDAGAEANEGQEGNLEEMFDGNRRTRTRAPRRLFTYAELGQPSVVEMDVVNAGNIPAAQNCPTGCVPMMSGFAAPVNLMSGYAAPVNRAMSTCNFPVNQIPVNPAENFNPLFLYGNRHTVTDRPCIVTDNYDCATATYNPHPYYADVFNHNNNHNYTLHNNHNDNLYSYYNNLHTNHNNHHSYSNGLQ